MTVTKLGRDVKETVVPKFRAVIFRVHSLFLVDGISEKPVTAPAQHFTCNQLHAFSSPFLNSADSSAY